MGTSEEPPRRRFCRGAGCGVVFWICRHCDRGHQYCGERYRRKARRQQRRAANQRHWNPLSAWWLDSYSLAYTVSSLLNQLFGKGKEPFWEQAYTNLVRWIIELHRVFPERWVTLQQVYRCAIDPELFAAKIEEAEKLSDDLNTGRVFIKADVLEPQLVHLA